MVAQRAIAVGSRLGAAARASASRALQHGRLSFVESPHAIATKTLTACRSLATATPAGHSGKGDGADAELAPPLDRVQAGDAAAFDRIVNARHSCTRFDTDRPVDEETLQRVLEWTLVS